LLYKLIFFRGQKSCLFSCTTS